MNVHKVTRRASAAVALATAIAVAPFFASASFASRPLTPPASPTAVNLTSGNKSIAVTWSETSGGAIAYTATARAAGRAARVCKTKKLGCTIASAVNGVVYDVTVVARNASGASAPSSDATTIVGVPGPPLSAHATPAKASAIMSWAPPVPSGVTKVTSYMATASPGGFSCSASLTIISNVGRTCQIAGLTSGTLYTVTVTATNSFGTSVPSKPATVTPT